MATPYKFWIRGSSIFFKATDATGTVATGVADDAPDEILAPASPDWVEVTGYGASPELSNEGEEYKSPSGGLHQDSEPRWSFQIKTHRFVFPTDMPAYVTLLKHLSRQYVYFAVSEYDMDLHPADTCIAVTAKVSFKHTYQNGDKVLTIDLKKRTMTEALDA